MKENILQSFIVASIMPFVSVKEIAVGSFGTRGAMPSSLTNESHRLLFHFI